jgi:hypothetical protein
MRRRRIYWDITEQTSFLDSSRPSSLTMNKEFLLLTSKKKISSV